MAKLDRLCVHLQQKRLFAVRVCPLERFGEQVYIHRVPSRELKLFHDGARCAVLTLMVIDGVLRSPLLFVLVVLTLRCCFEWLHSPRVPTLENHPFRRTRASDVGAALPCLHPGFTILASRQSRRQIEASIDRGQSSRTHATGHAVESPSRLRWQPRIIVRYSRGPQPRRNTKWRRPRYILRQDFPWRYFSHLWS